MASSASVSSSPMQQQVQQQHDRHPPDEDDEDVDGFQKMESNRRFKHAMTNTKRVYIGNLPSPPLQPKQDMLDSPRAGMKQALTTWLKSQCPGVECFSVEVILSSKKPYALVDVGDRSNDVIRKLHQQVWQGQKLVVQREQRRNHNTTTENTRVHSMDKNTHIMASNNNKSNKSYNNHNQKQPFGKGWSAPRQQQQQQPPPISTSTQSSSNISTAFHRIPLERASQDIQSVVMDELAQHAPERNNHNNDNDVDRDDYLLNTAIASTAAASFLAAMNAFIDEPENDEEEDEEKKSVLDEPLEETMWNLHHNNENEHVMDNHNDNVVDQDNMEPETFVMKSMSELLEEFGQEDPNWKNQIVDLPMDDDTTAHVVSSSSNHKNNNKNKNNNNQTHDIQQPTNINRLAPQSKAPIHICLSSFGYCKGGAPPQKRNEAGSHRQPLLPLDCRDFAQVPQHLSSQTGLSGNVKRALMQSKITSSSFENTGQRRRLNPQVQQQEEEQHKDNHNLYDFATQVVAGQGWTALLEAQAAGHGYASPLEMTIAVGSDWGKHRSVVVCEWAATQLRNWLRSNENNVILQPVSIGTFHRDIESSSVPSQNYDTTTATTTTTTTTIPNLNHNNTKTNKTKKKKHMDMAGDW